ncbi:MAG TPA: GNAT family N-acetyltransferase [Bacilli bacterium]|nr:GNAT family N-acetyltransferase [Bacilli bacterium]
METARFRLARLDDLDQIMAIIKDAKVFMASQNSGQWQDQHPRKETIAHDIESSNYYVIEENGCVLAGMALLGYEPDYDQPLEGAWISSGPYLVIHRLAVAKQHHGRGLGAQMLKQAENIAKAKHIVSVRLDTHHRNTPMVRLLEKCGYTRIGAVLLTNFKRRIAFEKII